MSEETKNMQLTEERLAAKKRILSNEYNYYIK